VGYARARMENPDPNKFLDKMRNAYVSDIEHLDKHLARLFDGLKQRGLYDNTLIVFVSDHGEEFFDHGGWWHGQTLYNELVQVPLVMKLPGNVKGGAVNEDLARHLDLAPTLLQFAGQPPAPGMSGQPLVDKEGNFTNANIVSSYAENDFEDNILQAVRNRENTLIHANEGNPRGSKPVELYDRKADPAEKNNLAGKPELAGTQQQLDKTLADYKRASSENTPEPAAVELSDESREQLEGLGYLNKK
jgi:arylsulfatase A-like enzyme